VFLRRTSAGAVPAAAAAGLTTAAAFARQRQHDGLLMASVLKVSVLEVSVLKVSVLKNPEDSGGFPAPQLPGNPSGQPSGP
jgi:hypothetical protein